MTQDDMDGMYKQWLSTTSVPVALDVNLNDIREGAKAFANFIRDRVELKADDPPKE